MEYPDLVLEFVKPILASLATQASDYTQETIVTASFDLAEVAANEFINRYISDDDEISGDTPEDQQPDSNS